MVAWGKNGGRDSYGVWDGHVDTAICKMDNQQGLRYSTWNSALSAWMGEAFRGEWIHVYTWLSPFPIYLKLSQCSLLTGYIPIQKRKLKKIHCLTQFILNPTVNHRQLCYVLSSSKSSAKHTRGYIHRNTSIFPPFFSNTDISSIITKVRSIS